MTDTCGSEHIELKPLSAKQELCARVEMPTTDLNPDSVDGPLIDKVPAALFILADTSMHGVQKWIRKADLTRL